MAMPSRVERYCRRKIIKICKFIHKTIEQCVELWKGNDSPWHLLLSPVQVREGWRPVEANLEPFHCPHHSRWQPAQLHHMLLPHQGWWICTAPCRWRSLATSAGPWGYGWSLQPIRPHEPVEIQNKVNNMKSGDDLANRKVLIELCLFWMKIRLAQMSIAQHARITCKAPFLNPNRGREVRNNAALLPYLLREVPLHWIFTAW